ncbi:MAG: hypothetical protein HYT79_04070 [Elusimicrobia bacterium]|nr:hypothetical protein [Elusimicrobiota bacterium]
MTPRLQQIAAALLALAGVCWINLPIPSDHELWAVESLINPEAWSRDVYRELLSSGGYLRMHSALAGLLNMLGFQDGAREGLLVAALLGLGVFFAALFRLALTISGGRLAVAWASVALLMAETVVWPVGEGRILPAGMRHGLPMALILLGWNAYLSGSRGRCLAWLVGACALHGNPGLVAFGIMALVDGWTIVRKRSSWQKPLALWAAAGACVVALYIGSLFQPDTVDPRYAEAASRAIEGHISIFTAGRLQMGFSLMGLVLTGLIFWGLYRIKAWNERVDLLNLKMIAVILIVTMASSLYWDFGYRYFAWPLLPRLQAVKVGRLMDIVAVVYFCRFADECWKRRFWPPAVGLLVLAFASGSATDFFFRALGACFALGLIYAERRWAKILLGLSSAAMVCLPFARPAVKLLADRVSLAGAFLDKPSFDPWVVAVYALAAGLWHFRGRRVKTSWLAASTAAAVFLSALTLKFRGHWPAPVQPPPAGLAAACGWIGAQTPGDALVFIPPTLHPAVVYEKARRPIYLSNVTLDASNYYGRRADAVYKRWEELGFDFNGIATQERLFAQLGRIQERLTPELLDVLRKKYGIDYLLWPLDGKEWPYSVVYENDQYAVYDALDSKRKRSKT